MNNEQRIDFKTTLNLPRTTFPMRANLPKREPELLAKWAAIDLYGELRRRRAKAEKYILHDGPPYANGHIHMGTALNKILKDFIVKVKNMEGRDAVYVPGWDCHGLPIEHQVDRELGEHKHALSQLEVRQRCRQFAEHYVDIQRREFKRLGVIGDWEHPYLTMTNHYEATIVRELGKLIGSGCVYHGLKPIHWCSSCRTALAEAEVEYEERESPSIFVSFPLHTDGTRFAGTEKPVSVLIWTTTPWTLPANLAISLHPAYDYVAVDVGKEIFLLAERLTPLVMEELGVASYEIIDRFPGAEVEGWSCRHPLYERESKLILGEHVTLDQGTGCVHTAPGHGIEDYVVGQRYGLEVYNPVDGDGRFMDDVEFFAGQNVFEANVAVIAKLRDFGRLPAESRIRHSYPHCWRCRQPLIFRATAQWFVAMDATNLRSKALEEINRVTWIPAWGKERIFGMVANRPDWCISRQRSWGVPITVFRCAACEEILASQEVAEHVGALIEQHGADVWFERQAADLLPAGARCAACGDAAFTKESDILDVWFESGVSHAAVLDDEAQFPGLRWPADMYLEGSDQHRGWFHSSLLVAVGTHGAAPYHEVLTHGYVVDGEGKKMSKSFGNVISPQDIIDKNGAEILRLWVAAENYREDIRISQEILARLADAYRKIRNTCRFLLGNLFDFDAARHRVPYAEMAEIDRFMLHRLQYLIARLRGAFARHEYHVFFHSFHNFCVVDLSSFYLDVLKDRLYTERADAAGRRAAQTVLHELLSAMVRLMAPILSFTAEEIWEHLPNKDEEAPSVHCALLPEVNEAWRDAELAASWEELLAVRSEVSKALENARRDKRIGGSLEAHVDLFVADGSVPILDRYAEDLWELFIVSSAHVHRDQAPSPAAYTSEAVAGLAVDILPATGEKCERCWTIASTIGSDARYPTVCARCAARLS